MPRKSISSAERRIAKEQAEILKIARERIRRESNRFRRRLVASAILATAPVLLILVLVRYYTS